MSFDSYPMLARLSDKYGPQEFGRICQALLELTLRRSDFSTRGRPVERPDITAERLNERYAIEAKVPVGARVELTRRDLDGLFEFATVGVVPIVAVLLVEPNPQWIMALARNLRPGRYNKVVLSAYDHPPLSQTVNGLFPTILSAQFDFAMGRGSEGLRSKL